MTEASIFAVALEKSAEERAAYVKEACAGDYLLRRRVEALLRAHAEPDDILDPPAAPPTPPEMTVGYVSPDEVVGTLVAGRYKLLEQIGEGGMGAVWMAEQREPVKRLVGVKLIKPGMDSKAVLARFEAERQALALMDHPNIARVLDGGTTEHGRPFFAMELVKGLPLTEYCDSRRLRVNDRLNLFVQVCAAVQHAHQKGIIHRDLKPSNVLVTEHDGKPVPKVIDFGLAKALHAAGTLTDRTLHTAYGAVVGTPLYMAPEQVGINALDVDTRTDIYALGVILYELLTGTTPLEKQRFKEAAWEEMKRVIREEEPPRPSTRLSSSGSLPSLAAQRQMDPAKLSKLVRGEPDWIVLKALEKDRNRRYETANGFAMDIRRYLAGEPVLAAPPSARYRLRKFARKHRAALTTTAVVVLLLVAGVAVSTWLAVRAATQAEHLAREERNRAVVAEELARENFHMARQAVDDYFTTVSENTLLKSPLPGLQPLRKKLLEQALQFYQNFARQRAGDPTVKVELARAYYRSGLISRDIGAKPDALEALVKARQGYEELVRTEPHHREWRRELARCYRHDGMVQGLMSRMPEAIHSTEQAVALGEALVAEQPEDAEARRDLAWSYNNLAICFTDDVGQNGRGLAANDQAIATWERLTQDHPAVAEYQVGLGQSCHNRGEETELQGRLARARDYYRRAVAGYEKAVQADASVLDHQNRLAATYGSLGWLCHIGGPTSEALPWLRKALAIQERLARENPMVTEYQYRLLETSNKLADYYVDIGQAAQAHQVLESIISRGERLAEDHASNYQIQVAVLWFYRVRGKTLAHQGRMEEAMAPLNRAVAVGNAFKLNNRVAQYELAGAHAWCSAVARQNRVLPAVEKQALVQQHADLAMVALRKAVVSGWQNVAWLKTDTDLDPLRSRKDFQDLLVELEARADKKMK